MKKMLLLLWLCFMAAGLSAQSLHFRHGTFKIVQFSDLHYVDGNPASDAATDCLRKVTQAEKPDLIIITGDIIYSKPGNVALQKVLSVLSSLKVPFAMQFGNHDTEQRTSQAALYDQMQRAPYSVMPNRQITKRYDYVLPIFDEKMEKPEALIYCLDSHRFTTMKDVRGYDWIRFNQIAWYREVSAKYKKINSGRPLPALMFYHIPIPEYNLAIADKRWSRFGLNLEKAYSPNLNSGLFCSVKEMGDVMGMFCGHDNDNDYSVLYYNVLLAHCRYSGGDTEYHHVKNGARVIVLKEGKREFDTWIREREGGVFYKTTFPSSYIKPDVDKETKY